MKRKSRPLDRIVKKRQKRRDGKKVYYYVNKDLGKIASRKDFEKWEETKRKYKSYYKDNWLKEINSIKSFEKKTNKKSKLKNEVELIKEAELKLNDGFPYEFGIYINNSIKTEVIDMQVNGKVLIISKGLFYLLDRNEDFLNFNLLIDELNEFYFDKIKELYSGSKKKVSPFIMYPTSIYYENPDYFGVEFDQITGSEETPLNAVKNGFEKLVKKANDLFFNYFSDKKNIDIAKLMSGYYDREKGNKKGRKGKKR